MNHFKLQKNDNRQETPNDEESTKELRKIFPLPVLRHGIRENRASVGEQQQHGTVNYLANTITVPPIDDRTCVSELTFPESYPSEIHATKPLTAYNLARLDANQLHTPKTHPMVQPRDEEELEVMPMPVDDFSYASEGMSGRKSRCKNTVCCVLGLLVFTTAVALGVSLSLSNKNKSISNDLIAPPSSPPVGNPGIPTVPPLAPSSLPVVDPGSPTQSPSPPRLPTGADPEIPTPFPQSIPPVIDPGIPTLPPTQSSSEEPTKGISSDPGDGTAGPSIQFPPTELDAVVPTEAPFSDPPVEAVAPTPTDTPFTDPPVEAVAPTEAPVLDPPFEAPTIAPVDIPTAPPTEDTSTPETTPSPTVIVVDEPSPTEIGCTDQVSTSLPCFPVGADIEISLTVCDPAPDASDWVGIYHNPESLDPMSLGEARYWETTCWISSCLSEPYSKTTFLGYSDFEEGTYGAFLVRQSESREPPFTSFAQSSPFQISNSC